MYSSIWEKKFSISNWAEGVAFPYHWHYIYVWRAVCMKTVCDAIIAHFSFPFLWKNIKFLTVCLAWGTWFAHVCTWPKRAETFSSDLRDCLQEWGKHFIARLTFSASRHCTVAWPSYFRALKVSASICTFVLCLFCSDSRQGTMMRIGGIWWTAFISSKVPLQTYSWIMPLDPIKM